jgi:hypothetical protein
MYKSLYIGTMLQVPTEEAQERKYPVPVQKCIAHSDNNPRYPSNPIKTNEVTISLFSPALPNRCIASYKPGIASLLFEQVILAGVPFISTSKRIVHLISSDDSPPTDGIDQSLMYVIALRLRNSVSQVSAINIFLANLIGWKHVHLWHFGRFEPNQP